MGRKGKMELQMEDEEAATGGGETEPTASFEIDLDDSNINVGKKKGSRGAPSSRASGGVAPPMSPDMPSVSPQMSTRTKVPRGMVLAPKWSRIAHYGVHAFMLLLIIILTLVLVLVELDAKDGGDDGVANTILKPFKLNLDGVVVSNDRARVCEQQYTSNPRGSSSNSDASNNGYVQAALMYQNVMEDLIQDLDILDDLIGEDAVFITSKGNTMKWPEYKAMMISWRTSDMARSYHKDNYFEMSGFAMSSYEAVIQGQFKSKKTNEVTYSFFVTFLFNPQTGKISRHAYYPSLSFSVERTEAVKLVVRVWAWALHASKEEYSDDDEFEKKLSILDDLLSDDITTTFNSVTAAKGIDAYKTYLRQIRQSTKVSSDQTISYREIYSAGDVVIERFEEFLDIGDKEFEDNYLVIAGYTDFKFDSNNRIITQQAYSTDLLTKRGENALKFHQTLNDTLSYSNDRKASTMQALNDIVDADNYVIMNSNGQVLTFSQLLDTFSTPNGSERQKSLQGDFASDMYTVVEFDNAVFVLWHNQNTATPVIVHHFKPGSAVIVNTYLTPVFYREKSNGEIIDIYNSEQQMVVSMMRELGGSGSEASVDVDQYMTDDFMAYTFWGGKEDKNSFFASGRAHFARWYSNYDSSLTRIPLARISKSFGFVSHGRWTYVDGDGETKEAGSNLGIFYFDGTAENIEDRKIQTVYIYNSTANMVAT